jgi:hypothetical protein
MIRPIQHLHSAGHLYPNAWRHVEKFRQDRGGDLPRWPAWCFLPLAGWYAIVSEDSGGESVPLKQISDVGRLAAVGTWRYTQGVYRLSTEFMVALSRTQITGEIPVEVLLRLPEWCVYIEVENMNWGGLNLHGFFAHLEWDAKTERTELRFLLDTEAALLPIPLHIGPWNLTEAIERAMAESQKQAMSLGKEFRGYQKIPKPISKNLSALVSMVLYLCSEQPDIVDKEPTGKTPSRPKPTKIKKGWKLFPPEKPTIWMVGGEISRLISKIQDEPDQSDEGIESRRLSPRPHIRRGHWHGFWTGPKKTGDRKYILKWLPPMVVSAGE